MIELVTRIVGRNCVRKVACSGLVALSVLGGCTNASISPSAAPTVSSPSPTAIAEVICTPNAYDACLGPLDAGTHRSALFRPQLTYDIPAGWGNHADSPGEYVLFAPGSVPAVEEGGARDWIAFLANVTYNPEGCVPEPTFDPNATAADIADWMSNRVNLATSSPAPTTVGGLDGTVIDVRLADGATPECFATPAVFLVHGIEQSEGYDQGIGPGVAMRFYFFDNGSDVLMIELDDVSGGDRLDEFSAVVRTVHFLGVE
jgi:hypothetical protein